ncbi:MAG: hypothetical protein RI935_158 [Candidatus Parcubacteria bacterium]|jgi:hypothetical protein
MEAAKITTEDFQKVVKNICARDTSADPEHWSAENPMWGHCAVLSLLAQDQFGGTLVRQSLEDVEGLEYLRSHYSNKLPDGTDADFTFEQFQGKLLPDLIKEVRPRERVLSYPDTVKRYEFLKSRFEAGLSKI